MARARFLGTLLMLTESTLVHHGSIATLETPPTRPPSELVGSSCLVGQFFLGDLCFR